MTHICLSNPFPKLCVGSATTQQDALQFVSILRLLLCDQISLASGVSVVAITVLLLLVVGGGVYINNTQFLNRYFSRNKKVFVKQIWFVSCFQHQNRASFFFLGFPILLNSEKIRRELVNSIKNNFLIYAFSFF